MPLALLPSSARSKNSTTVRSGSGDPATRQRMAKAAVQLAFALSDDLGGRAATYLFTTPRRHHQPERERVVLEGARPFTVEVQREAPRWRGQPIRVAAWRWGHGPAALLVHGWRAAAASSAPWSRRCWRPACRWSPSTRPATAAAAATACT
jgi:hypothetical protein